ncbi:MAG TPA: HNH endonuclease [Acidimicrobiia bacterium]|nr:HNH endonuclease [Acidimicrobiia bacterium]
MELARANALIDQAIECLEKVNAGLSPNLYAPREAQSLHRRYARLVKLATFGELSLADRVGDPGELAIVNGTSMGEARRALDTSRQMAKTPPLEEALRRAELSSAQAHEIAKTESVAPGSAGPLLEIARNGRFHTLKEEARRMRLEAQAGPGLAQLQHESRFLHHRVTDKGMVHFEGELEPHIGIPIASRLESEARRLARIARNAEPFDRHMADALPTLLSGTGKGSGRTEMVVLVSYEVPERGWTHVEEGEFCKIPGVGPIDPEVARRIAGDAFLSGVFYDGRDLRQMKRWGRSMPAAIRTALNLGDPPEFEGVRCVDCGNRFWIEWDHDTPHAAGGPISIENSKPRCWRCHRRKTREDIEAGRLRRRRATPSHDGDSPEPIANSPP